MEEKTGLAARAENWRYPEFEKMGHGARYMFQAGELDDLVRARRRISMAARRWLARNRAGWSSVTRVDRREHVVYLWFVNPYDARPVRDHLGAPIA